MSPNRPPRWLSSRKENFIGAISLQAQKRKSPARNKDTLSSKTGRTNWVLFFIVSKLHSKIIHVQQVSEKSFTSLWRESNAWINIYVTYIPCSPWGRILALKWGGIWLLHQTVNHRTRRQFVCNPYKWTETGLRSALTYQKTIFVRPILHPIRVEVVWIVNQR